MKWLAFSISLFVLFWVTATWMGLGGGALMAAQQVTQQLPDATVQIGVSDITLPNGKVVHSPSVHISPTNGAKRSGMPQMKCLVTAPKNGKTTCMRMQWSTPCVRPDGSHFTIVQVMDFTEGIDHAEPIVTEEQE